MIYVGKRLPKGLEELCLRPSAAEKEEVKGVAGC